MCMEVEHRDAGQPRQLVYFVKRSGQNGGMCPVTCLATTTNKICHIEPSRHWSQDIRTQRNVFARIVENHARHVDMHDKNGICKEKANKDGAHYVSTMFTTGSRGMERATKAAENSSHVIART